ncbi:MAG TPA: OsmC family protein [Panacibacter sp.]|nr:OsmC family protein [Panacibacter sp.]HNP46340.1 OsmC family protein [Panacibacter sp.]
MTSAKVSSAKYRTELYNGRHQFFADEPAEIGGADTAPAPDELLEAALASCSAITIKMYAERKGWTLAAAEVNVSLVRINGKTTIHREIALQGELDQEQKDRLLQIAKLCPVSKTLAGEIDILSTLK